MHDLICDWLQRYTNTQQIEIQTALVRFVVQLVVKQIYNKSYKWTLDLPYVTSSVAFHSPITNTAIMFYLYASALPSSNQHSALLEHLRLH